MKKVLVAVAMMMSVGSSVAMAQGVETSDPMVAVTAEVGFDDYVEIEVSELPMAVTKAVMEAYGTCVKEAYVSLSEEGLTYKLVLTAEDVEGVVVFMNEHGELLM